MMAAARRLHAFETAAIAPLLSMRVRIGERQMLSADELERYARHIVLREVGGPGQRR